MASIYKRAANAKDKRSPWFIGYTDENGKRRTLKGFTDKAETERLAARLEHEVMLRKRGLIDPELETRAQKRKIPLTEHLAAFEKSLAANTRKHVKIIMGRIRCVVNGLGAKVLGDLSVEKVEDFLRAKAAKENIGNRTYNHYIQALDEFCGWLVKNKRATANPVVGLKRLNTAVDVRRRRRALTPEEVAKLINTARASRKKIQCFDGEARARIYTVAYMTGLRRGELGSLTPESFNLAADPPTVTVEAANSKHRRRDVIPLHPDLVAMLKEWLPGYSAGKPLFPKLALRRTWRMVQKDLERAGIPFETKDGVADFHAAGRHTYITELLRNGATLPEAKELARHSDINMTMRYTHIGIGDQARALSNLPSVTAPSATGNGSGPRADATASSPPLMATDGSGAQRFSSVSGDADCHSGASGDTGESSPRNDATPVADRGCLDFSPSDAACTESG